MDTIDELFQRQHGASQRAALGVALFGLNERSRAALTTVLRTAPNLACHFPEEAHADVAIVDGDGPETEAMLAELRRRFPDLVLVVLFDEAAASKVQNVLTVKKPIQVSRLLHLLEEIGQGMGPRKNGQGPLLSSAALRTLENCLPAGQRAAVLGHRGGAAPDGIGASLADRRREQWFYAEEESICGLILHVAKACMADGAARRIAYLGQRVSILPKLGLVDGDLSAAQLKQFGFMRFQEQGGSSFEVTELSFEAQTETRRKTILASAHCVGLEVFVWKVAAAASRGRAPEGTDLEAPMAMRHWPNMTRLQPLPHALRVAALWDAGPRSLRECAEVLGVRLASVLTFYTAASAIGLVVPARRQVDSLLQPSPLEPPERSGLLSLIQHTLSEPPPGNARAEPNRTAEPN